MYTNIITALAVIVVLTVLILAYVHIMTTQQSYYICKIAKITIQEHEDRLYVASSKPAVIHIFLMYSNNGIKHLVCYTECQVPKAPLVVTISPYDIAWHGDLDIVGRVLYLSPCGVTNYVPNCWPWIELPTGRASVPRELPSCDCSYETVLTGGVLGLCRVR